MEENQTDVDREEKEKNYDKPRRSKLVAWNRSRVKNLDRQGRWEDYNEGDNHGS